MTQPDHQVPANSKQGKTTKWAKDSADKSGTSDKYDIFKRRWFQISAFLMVLAIVLALCGVLIAHIIFMVHQASPGDGSNGQIASDLTPTLVIALYGTLITALFISMTFRVDQVAQSEA